VTDPEGESGLAIMKDDLMNAFNTWIKINDVDLDDLSEDVPLSNRKGHMKRILNDLANVGSGRLTINEERGMAFKHIDLSEDGYEILHTD
jgi:hypothetical protein